MKKVRSRILHFWHSKLVHSAMLKPSLKYLRIEFLPLVCGPHPLWLSCQGSPSALEAAKILSGRYRDDYLLSKFNNSSGRCTLGSCTYFPGDVTHYLSGDCPYLTHQLQSTLDHSLKYLSEFPLLIPPTLHALSQSTEEKVSFILDPYSYGQVIPIRQKYGAQSVWPLFKLSRSYIWCMHREGQKC